MNTLRSIRFTRLLASVALTTLVTGHAAAAPSLLDPGLQVTTWASGLGLPTGISFIGANDALVLDKNTGRVNRVVNGVASGVALDLAVNSAGQRGLLGIAVSPTFATDGNVFLYWTESSTGADTADATQVALLANRVDRFKWNAGTGTLAFDGNVARLRAIQSDSATPGTSNNGGVMRFGPDGKLYVAVGDVGRRGWTQNLANGPTGVPGSPDDSFGGPAPDNAHLTGVVLRLNQNGSTPTDNPFFAAGAAIGGEVGANVQKIFSYGTRNSFGMAFDPVLGALWNADNGDDAYDEINRVGYGTNGGWIQAMGPISRFDDYKTIESASANGLGQARFAPTALAADGPSALSSMFMLPGAIYTDPQFSWRNGIAPSALGFMQGAGIGAAYDGDMFVGAATSLLEGGYLMRLRLTADRLAIDTSADPRLADRVADNLAKFTLTESETMLFGRGFGTVTDIRTGTNGHLFVTSLSDGAIYEISPGRAGEPISVPASALLLAPALLALGALRRR